ncbi:glycosyltransferase [Pedobacter sp. LMG 31464]|uniref:Glycosyltransferase n=1 Tax=Pedobacter planticolens TaxID=2679964 RepID=A0A923E005_9SPHI|nr:glycosyltransferase family 4 protein [Pedobacter planticolens]MBB2145898.1 glycosyltransferase [Pedobacter planticolens]
MKVLIIHNRYKEKGGEETTVANEYELLKANKVDVEVVYFDNNGSQVSQLLKFLSYPFNLRSYFRIRKIIAQAKPDVVHIHNFFFACSPLAFWALKHKHIPFVITIQNFRLICPSYTLFNKGSLYLKSIKKKFSFEPVLDKVYRNSMLLTFWLYVSNFFHYKIGTWGLTSQFIFVSKFSKNIFEQSALDKYRAKFSFKPNFMEAPLPTVKGQEDYFIFIGRLTEEKGIDVLIESCNSYNFKLIIIGDGDMKGEILKLSNQNDNVTYLGFRDKTDIINYLSKAKALIFPSIWFEGMPLTIIESFSVATPVIASNLGAMSEMIQDHVNGFHFVANDAIDLISKIKLIQQLDTEEYNALRDTTKLNFNNTYTAELNYRFLTDIYQKAIEQNDKKNA